MATRVAIDALGGDHAPDEVIRTQQKRMRPAFIYLLDHADCPYEVIGGTC